MDTPGAQADLIRIRPTILIGLGGTGGDVILRVRKRFYEKYGTLSEFPIVAYLWLDTDKSEKHILGKEVREFVRMTDVERLMLTIGDTTVITQNLKEPNNAHIDKWWYPGLNALGQMNEGAGQIRAYSRLAFFHHYKAIRAAVTEANTRVRDPHAMEKMMHSPILKDQGILAQVEFNQPTNVYLVTSIAGGTGSGLLLDAAFMIKDLFQEGNVTLSSFLVFPDHFGTITNEKMKANAYALLKELNYYKYGSHTFDAEWSLGVTARVPIPPFDYCYVFDNQNAAGQATGGQPGSQELIFELLADSIFKDFSHGEFADHKRSARVNLRQYMNKTYEHAHPRFKQNFIQRYQSFGMSTIVVPHARITTACAYKLATEVVDLWSGQSKATYNQADLPRFVREDFLPALHLLEDDAKRKNEILFSLLDAGGLADPDKGRNQGLLDELSKWSQEVVRSVERGQLGPRQTLRDFLEEKFVEQEKRLKAEELGAEPEKWGHFPRTIRANLEALEKRASEDIRKKAFQLVDQKNDSLKYSEAVLNETVEVLRSFVTTFQKKQSDIQDVLVRRQKEATRRLQEVGRYQSRSNLDGRKGIILAYVAERYLEALVGDSRTPGLLRCQLQARIYKEGAELIERLARAIQGSERPDGRRGGGMVDQLTSLARDLEGLKNELAGGFKYFSQKDPQPQALVLYEPTDIESKYYPAYVKSTETVQAVSKAVLKRLERAVTGLAADIAAGRTEEWKRALLTESRNLFAGLKTDFHVVKVLYTTMDEQTRNNHLRQMYSRSAYWATKSGLHGTFQLPEEQVHTMCGLPSAAGMSPSDAAELTGYLNQLKAYLTREVTGKLNFYPIPESSEIIFYQEAGGFPINYMARLTDLRGSYLKLYTNGEPLHIDCNDKKFPDLMVLNQEERRSLEEAYECWVLGCLFDVLEFKGGEYLWQERDGFQMRPHPLGDRHMMLVKLTTGAATREKLYKLVKQRRDAVLSTQDEQEMAAYCALLEHYKREAYGEKWGKVSSESELAFEDMMTVRVLSDEVQHVMESPLVRSLGPEAIGQKAEEVMANAEQFTRKREDGKLALLAATKTKP